MNPQEILARTQDAFTARRVFGDPIQADGVTIIPAAVVMGGGGGGSQTEGNAAGFGLRARPAGVFIVRDGEARWRPAIDVNKVIMGGQLIAIVALVTLGPVLAALFTRRRPARESLPD